MKLGIQNRYMIKEIDSGRVAMVNTGTIHLNHMDSYNDVKLFKERRTAEACIAKNKEVLKNCIAVQCRITYEV